MGTFLVVSVFTYVAIRLGLRGFQAVQRARSGRTREQVVSEMTACRTRCEESAAYVSGLADEHMKALFLVEVESELARRSTLTAAARSSVSAEALTAITTVSDGTVLKNTKWPHRLGGPDPPTNPVVRFPAKRAHDDALLFVQTQLRERDSIAGKVGAFVSRAAASGAYSVPPMPEALGGPMAEYWENYSDLLEVEKELAFLVPKDEDRSQIRASTISVAQRGAVNQQPLTKGRHGIEA